MIALTLLISTFVTAVLCDVDYVAEVNQRHDVVKSRNEAYEWLLSQRNNDWGWGTRDYPETHRALTAIFLSGETQNETGTLEYLISVKELELQLSLALTRFPRRISAGQLALYANALLATCRNPNDFYGHNIIKIMRPERKLSVYSEALVSLAVSNSGNILNKTELLRYFDFLDNHNTTSHGGIPDTKAMVILALSSAMRYYKEYRFIRAHIRLPLKLLKHSQKPDGSFGNIYSSALVMQALMGAGDKGSGWDFQKGIDYILSQQKSDGSFGDLLATYFALPVLAGRSLVDLGNISCSSVNTSLEDNDLKDEEWNNTISVRYSIWGDTPRPISSVFTVPEGSNFLDVMEEAQKLDKRYRFSGTSYSWGFYVQTIGNLTVDTACNKFWILFTVNRITGERVEAQNGVTKEFPQNGDHYMFRYVKLMIASTNTNSTCEDDVLDRNSTDISEDILDTEESLDNFVLDLEEHKQLL